MSDQMSASSGSPSLSWRTLLQIVSVVTAIEIALHSFIVKEPVVTLFAASLWLAGSFWVRRGGRGGPILIGALALFGVVGTLFFSEELGVEANTPAWIFAVHLVLLAAALLAVVMTLKTREAMA